MENKLRKLIADECYKNSSCFDTEGKQIDCLTDCAYVKNLATSILLAIQQELIKMLGEEKGSPGDIIPVDDVKNTGEAKGYINGYNACLSDMHSKIMGIK